MNGRVCIAGKWYEAARFTAKGIWRVSDLKGAPPGLTVMRVLHAGHPAFEDGLRGIVKPWGGDRPLTVDAVIAQTSGTRPDTGLTSWSTDRAYTTRLAMPGDLILVHRVKASDAILPPNAIGAESEILIHNTIRGVRCIRR